MSSQRWRTLANPKGGKMAATNSRYMKWTSRQRLRRSCQLVAPGGKMLGIVEQAFQQQGHQQLAVQPGTAAIIPPLRQISQPEDRFHPLETQFDLPSTAIPGQNSLHAQGLRRNVSPHEEVPSQEQGRLRRIPLLLRRPLAHRLLFQGGGPTVPVDRQQPP